MASPGMSRLVLAVLVGVSFSAVDVPLVARALGWFSLPSSTPCSNRRPPQRQQTQPHAPKALLLRLTQTRQLGALVVL